MQSTWVPIFGIFFVFGGAVAVVALAMRNIARKLEHEEVMKALELGKDIPMLEVKRHHSFLSDMRFGVFFLAGGAGLFFAGQILESRQTMAFSLIPLFIGIGFVVVSMIVRLIGDQNSKNGD